MEDIKQGKRQDDRFKMDCQARWRAIPVNRLVGKLEKASVNRVPEHLVHIAKVKRRCFERVIAQYRLVAHIQGVDHHNQYEKSPGY